MSASYQPTMNDMSQRTQQAVGTGIAVVAAGAVEVGRGAERYGRRLVKMIWDPIPVNDRDLNRPVWCLGCSYTIESGRKTERRPSQWASSKCTHSSNTITETETESGQANSDTPLRPGSNSFSSLPTVHDEALEDSDGGWPSHFLDDFESRIWMTYRCGFETIPRSTGPNSVTALSLAMRLRTLSDQSGFSSDTGWGCMIRSGQSLLANTLSICQLGRNWRRRKAENEASEVVSRFADDSRAPYSIHNFVRHGALACGKHPGEWFGPSATARCIQALVNSNEKSLRVYSTGDLPDVYEDSFVAVAKPDGEIFCPTLILVGTRLGIDKINQVYWEALAATLQLPQSVGIAGGRPSQSHYFVGAQRSGDEHEPGSYLFYLDPHFTQPALPFYEDPSQYVGEEIDSCHTRRLRRLHVREVDPSMLIGFLIKDEDDWDTWKKSIQYVQGKAVINVSDHDPARAMPSEREGAIDEVETLSDDDDKTAL